MKNYSQKIKDIVDKEIDPAYIDRAEIILSEIVKKGKILEIGCGRGFYLKALKDINQKINITGIDLNQQYLNVAKKYVDDNNVKIIKGDATKLKFKKNTFEGIIASEILEHIKDDTKVIKEIKRVLKPKGIVILSVPNQEYPFCWDPLNWCLERIFKTHIPSKTWWLAGIWAGHVRLYKEDNLVEKIEKSGLKIKKIWRVTKHCLPFSHFLFYGIGKNIVEKGGLKNFNRFEKNKKSSYLFKVIKKIIYLADKKNNREFKKGEKTTNLVIMAQKN